MRFLVSILLLALLLAFEAPRIASASVQTGSFTDDSFVEFSQGDLTTSTLTFDGRILPLGERTRLAELDADVVWDVLDMNGLVYTATGSEGMLFAVPQQGEARLVHDFEEPGLFALAPLPDGSVAVATAPGGVVYTSREGGETRVFSHTGAAVVWSMLRTDDGILAATGTPASILRIQDDGTTVTLAAVPNVLNVLHLQQHPKRGVVFASQGPGLIGRVSPDGEVSVLFDPAQEEVRRVVVLEDGTVFGAVNGERAPGEKLLKDAQADQKQGNQKPRPSSFIVRITPDDFASEWWTSPESPIHDMIARPDGSLIVSAGTSGNIYQVTPEGQMNRLGIAEESFVTRIVARGADLLLATGSSAAVYTYRASNEVTGSYESRVFDARESARWTRVRGDLVTNDGRVLFAVRSGNTPKPDETWSEWSENVSLFEEAAIPGNIVSRFLQYRLILDVPAVPRPTPPQVDRIRIFYTTANQAPIIRSLNVGAPRPSGGGSSQAGGGGGSGGASSAGSGLRPNDITLLAPTSEAASPVLEASWSVEDPDGDDLLYSLFLRGLKDQEWLLLEKELTGTRQVLDLRGLPDGTYRLKLVATDATSNTAAAARTVEQEGNAFLVDNTPPQINVASIQRNDEKLVEVRVEVEDSTSVIHRAAWRSGFGNFVLLKADDGGYDQRKETFSFTIEGENARRGRYISFFVTDETGNLAIQRIDLP